MAFVDPNHPVAKGPVTYCLDEISTWPDARKRLEKLRDAIIERRKDGYYGLEKVFAKHLFTPVYRDAKQPKKADRENIRKITAYLKTYWFDEKTGAWPQFQPIAPIYAEGLLKTLNESLAARGPQPLPIDSYWSLGYSGVELLTLVSARQVTLLILTPAPLETAPSGIWGESSKAWATSRRAGKIVHEVDPKRKDARVSGQTKQRIVTQRIQNRRRRS